MRPRQRRVGFEPAASSPTPQDGTLGPTFQVYLGRGTEITVGEEGWVLSCWLYFNEVFNETHFNTKVEYYEVENLVTNEGNAVYKLLKLHHCEKEVKLL